MNEASDTDIISLELFPALHRNEDNYVFPDVNYIFEELTLQGFSIVPGQLNESEMALCRKEIDAQLAIQEQAFGQDNLHRIADHGVARSPFLFSSCIRDQCLAGRVRDIADRVFGDQYILNLNRAAVIRPEDSHPAATWHRDSAYVNFTTSQALSLSFLHLIDGSNADNGGIALLPGSHLWERFPSREYVRRNAVIPDIPRGALLIFDSSMFHCGTKNLSAETRRSLLTVFSTPLYKPSLSGCNPHPLYVGCAVIRQARVSEWKLMF